MPQNSLKRQLYAYDDTIAHREYSARMFSAVFSAVLCALVIFLIFYRNKWRKNNYETLCSALSIWSFADSISWAVCSDPATPEYHENDFNAKVIQTSLVTIFVERLAVFVANSITTYMAFTIVYTMVRCKMVPRTWFWRFHAVAFVIGLFFQPTSYISVLSFGTRMISTMQRTPTPQSTWPRYMSGHVCMSHGHSFVLSSHFSIAPGF